MKQLNLFAALRLCAMLFLGAIAVRLAQADPATTQPATSPATTRSSSGSLDEFVIYSNDVGWLRVGPRAEYEAKSLLKDEINGGTSEKPVKKALIAPGFDSRDSVLKELCDHLTKVQLRIVPPAAGGPARYL